MSDNCDNSLDCTALYSKKKTERFAYGFKPTGQEQSKILQQKACYEPRTQKKLMAAFEKWLRRTEPQISHGHFGWAFSDFYGSDISGIRAAFSCAENLTKKVEASLGDVHGFVQGNSDHPLIELAGLFLSPLYCKVSEDIIFYDLDVKLHGLGFNLPKKKTLVVKSSLGNHTGASSEGIVLNYGVVGTRFGAYAKFAIINYGKADNFIGEKAEGIVVAAAKPVSLQGAPLCGILLDFNDDALPVGEEEKRYLINFGVHADNSVIFLGNENVGGQFTLEGKVCQIKKPLNGENPRPTGVAITEQEASKIPGLMEYVKTLEQGFKSGKDDYTKAINFIRRGLGDSPALTIETRIREMLRAVNYSRKIKFRDGLRIRTKTIKF